MKLWAGRFNKEEDERVNDFNSSIRFDKRMVKEDIEGSIAHATMLNACKIISDEAVEKITNELKKILADIESGKLKIDKTAEDIHMFVEAELTKRIGDFGKQLHTARSRNDQVAVDIRLYTRKEIKAVIELLKTLEKVLLNKAKENTLTIMPGYTHLQRAQPITFSHHILAYSDMFFRDITRLKNILSSMNIMPLGSGALAGTTHAIDRNITAKLLEFDAPSSNSLDGVSDRDFLIELLSALSIIMMHLSRFSEEIIMWCSWEFKFIELDDAFATGSSIMPQKKNPDICELIRGKTGRVYGSLMTLLTVMKGIPLAYNKDMQEDKECVFDAIDTVKSCIETFIPMFDTMKVIKENMLNAAKKGFINATDCADYLAKKGVPFRDAYKITGSLVNYAIQNGIVLEQISLETYKEFSEVFDIDIYDAIDLKTCVNERKSIGGPNSELVKKHIEANENKLKNL